MYRCTIQHDTHDTHDTHDLVRSRTILLIPDHFVAPSNVVQRFQVKLYSGLLIVWCYETVHTVEISGCNGGGAGGDSGTAALEVREREAHITATVRSAICVCDAVSVERLAAHDLARSCTIPHDLARYRTIPHDLARSTEKFLQIRGRCKGGDWVGAVRSRCMWVSSHSLRLADTALCC